MAKDMGATLADDTETIAGLVAAAGAALSAGVALEGDEARREAEVLLAAALRIGRATLLAHPERRVGGEDLARARDWLARRARGEPLAYLTGVREFWSLPFHVTPDVLVPRPETEEVVSRALALGDELGARSGAVPTLVDLGTGSGCIALAIARERPTWRITATDTSPHALRVARGNARSLDLARVEFVEGSWYSPLVGRHFDLIVSNPPYVAGGDAALDDPALRHEPRVALTPEGDGLAALRHLVEEAPGYLRPGGCLVLEHGVGQGRDFAQMLEKRGFRHVRCAPDLAGRDRVTSAQWPLFAAGTPMIRFETSLGSFDIELNEKEAPLSAANFLAYVEAGFFDGTLFHRVIPGFMIQGGGMTTGLAQKKARAPIQNEAKNGLKNRRGTLSMARTNDIHSATSQFFVNLVDNAFLDHAPGNYGYAVFGHVAAGMDTVEKIAQVKTGRSQGHSDVPLEDVVVISAQRIDA